MTAKQFRQNLNALGLEPKAAARALRMGRDGTTTIRSYLDGSVPVPGPVAVAIELMVERSRWVAIPRLTLDA